MTKITCDPQHCVASDARQNRMAFIVRKQLSVTHDEQILTGSFGKVSVRIQKYRLCKASADSIAHGQHRVDVLSAGFSSSRHHPRLKLAPGRNRYADSLLQTFGAKIGRPRPGENDHFHSAVARVNTQAAASQVTEWTNITTLEAILPDDLANSLSKFFRRVRDDDPEDSS